jgi:hypothetical protein
MAPQLSDVEAAALGLEPARRARLALRLIESLDREEKLTREQVEQLWLQEGEERLRQLEAGESEPIPAERVFKEARKNLKT